MYVNQSLSQPPKRMRLTPHEAPERAKLQAASSGVVRLTSPLELAYETPVRWKYRFFFFVVAENLCGATVTLSDLLELKDTVLDPDFCELTMSMIE